METTLGVVWWVTVLPDIFPDVSLFTRSHLDKQNAREILFICQTENTFNFRVFLNSHKNKNQLKLKVNLTLLISFSIYRVSLVTESFYLPSLSIYRVSLFTESL